MARRNRQFCRKDLSAGCICRFFKNGARLSLPRVFAGVLSILSIVRNVDFIGPQCTPFGAMLFVPRSRTQQ